MNKAAEPKVSKVIVIGGGIGGLSLARACFEDNGDSVRVCFQDGNTATFIWLFDYQP